MDGRAGRRRLPGFRRLESARTRGGFARLCQFVLIGSLGMILSGTTGNFDYRALLDRDAAPGPRIATAKPVPAAVPRRDFSHQTIVASNFAGRDLRGADFTGATILFSNFSHTDLSGAIFDGASIRASNFSRSRLVEARFDKASIEGVNLGRANLEQAAFRASTLHAVNLGRARMEGACFVQTRFSGVNLKRAKDYGSGCAETVAMVAPRD